MQNSAFRILHLIFSVGAFCERPLATDQTDLGGRPQFSPTEKY